MTAAHERIPLDPEHTVCSVNVTFTPFSSDYMRLSVLRD